MTDKPVSARRKLPALPIASNTSSSSQREQIRKHGQEGSRRHSIKRPSLHNISSVKSPVSKRSQTKFENDGTTGPDFTIDKKSTLGVGSYGAVYIAHWNELTCAAKIIHTSLFTLNIPGKPNIAEQFEKECEVISQFRHPNIVQFLGMKRDPDTLLPVLLTELMDKSLTSLLEAEESTKLPYSMQLSISHDISLAITYLHSKRFIHRDISSNNVLMRGNVAKLADLGVSVLIDSTRSNRLTQCPGTEVYMPPDSVSASPEYTEKIDCFSFGVLALQTITCEYPKPGPRMVPMDISSKMFRQVSETERRREDIEKVSNNHPLLELICKCLKDEETERPTAVEICRYVASLQQIEFEDRLNAEASGGVSKIEERKVEDAQLRQLKSPLEDFQSRVAALQSENESKTAEIARLERENATLANAQEPSLGRESGEEEFQRAQTQQIQELSCQVEQLEQEKRSEKSRHLEKWDWLESEYHLKKHAAQTAQQRVQELEDELRGKDQELEDLRNESTATNVEEPSRSSQEELQIAHDEIEDLSSQVEQLKKKLQEMNGRSDNLKERVEELEDKLKAKDEELENTLTVTNVKEPSGSSSSGQDLEELQTAKEIIEDLINQVQQLEGKLQEANDWSDNQKERVEVLEDKQFGDISNLEPSRSSLSGQDELQTAQDQIRNLSHQVQQLEERLQQTKDEWSEKLKERVEVLEDRLRAKDQQLLTVTSVDSEAGVKLSPHEDSVSKGVTTSISTCTQSVKDRVFIVDYSSDSENEEGARNTDPACSEDLPATPSSSPMVGAKQSVHESGTSEDNLATVTSEPSMSYSDLVKTVQELKRTLSGTQERQGSLPASKQTRPFTDKQISSGNPSIQSRSALEQKKQTQIQSWVREQTQPEVMYGNSQRHHQVGFQSQPRRVNQPALSQPTQRRTLSHQVMPRLFQQGMYSPHMMSGLQGMDPQSLLPHRQTQTPSGYLMNPVQLIPEVHDTYQPTLPQPDLPITPQGQDALYYPLQPRFYTQPQAVVSLPFPRQTPRSWTYHHAVPLDSLGDSGMTNLPSTQIDHAMANLPTQIDHAMTNLPTQIDPRYEGNSAPNTVSSPPYGSFNPPFGSLDTSKTSNMKQSQIHKPYYSRKSSMSDNSRLGVSDPDEYCDSVSIAEAMQSSDDEEVYLAALIQQKYITCQTQPWKVVFTVCRKNPCCIEPLLNLLKDEYDEKFCASTFSVKFSECEKPCIKLNIPEKEIHDQGYEITANISPCTIRKEEAFEVHESSYAYPPRYTLEIRPQKFDLEHCQQVLRVFLELSGTDDQRKFALTNPLIATVSAVGLDQEPAKRNILSCSPDIASDPLIVKIIGSLRTDKYWDFGSNLGVPLPHLEFLRPSPVSHQDVYRIFDCWNRAEKDPSKKTWKHILDALKATEENFLANEILNELCPSQVQQFS